MKPPTSKPPSGKIWKDLMPRQGKDPGDYPSVFDELDDTTRDDNVREGTGAATGKSAAKRGGKVKRKK